MARDDPKPRRTPPERSGTALCPRDASGKLLPIDALARFAAKCRFDPVTGCVIWTGGTTAGRGNSAVYGSFWYEGKRWFAHRWAGVHIHGLNLDAIQAGHCCPNCPPNTLCVEHVEPQTIAENVTERNVRVAETRRVEQSAATKQYWLFVQLGIEREPEPEPFNRGDEIPFYSPPEWLRPFLPEPVGDDCPF